MRGLPVARAPAVAYSARRRCWCQVLCTFFSLQKKEMTIKLWMRIIHSNPNYLFRRPYYVFTALFNNMRTRTFEGRPTNAFFAAVNQMFGGSSQLTTTAEHCFVVWTVHNDLITARSAVIGSWEEATIIWLTVAEKAFVGWALILLSASESAYYWKAQ